MHTFLRLGSGLLGALLALASQAWAAAPAFQRSDAVAVTVGETLDYRLVAIGDGVTYSAQGLPNGANLDPSTGRISGTPTDVGTYRVTVNATNADGQGSATLTISVVSPDAAPLIYAPLSFDAYDDPHPNGDLFTCSLKATGAPTSYQATGSLPAGWTFNSGTIVGSSTQPGLYLVPVSATNNFGTGSAGITVRVHPACTSVQQTTGTLHAGDAFTVTLQFNRPVSFSGAAPYLEFHTYPDSGTKRLSYVSGNGTSNFVFSYTVSANDAPGDILLYTAIQPAVGAEVSGLTDQDGITLGAAMPIYGTSTPAASIAASSTGTTPAPSPVAASATSNGAASPSSSAPQTASPTAAQTSSVNTSTSAVSTSGGSASSVSARLVNLSARGLVSEGDSGRSFIEGFVVSGSAPKRMLLRAVGPSLTSFGVQNALANPTLRLFDASGRMMSESNDWSGSETAATAADVGAFALPDGSKDAAMTVTLTPGSYSMQVLPNGGSGVALAEIYDADSTANERLVNLSTRGYVGTGEGVLTAGFVVQGDAPKRLLIRGVGPALAAYGVSGVLADPMVKVYQGNAAVAQNDDWEISQTAVSAADVAAATQAAGAFALGHGSHDAALIVTLAPGTYTAQVSGAGNTTGAALVEVYELP